MNIKRLDGSTQFLALLGILSVIVAGCSSSPVTVVPSTVPAPTSTPSPYWPTEGWRTSTPEEQGMDSQKLADLAAKIKERGMAVHSFLVIRNGYLVSETYFGSWKQDTVHETQSAGRNFTSALIGIAIDKGYIDGVDQRIVDFFPECRLPILISRRKT